MRRVLTTLVTLLLIVAPLATAQSAGARFEGRPTFKEGKALGYFIWRDGDTWKLRWTTFGAEHRFSGRVVVEGGQVASFKRIDVDEERKVIRPGSAPRVVRGPAGRVRGVRPGRTAVVAERTEDKIEQEDEHTLQWMTRTDDDIDGIDFKVTDPTVVIRFNLLIDGEPKPAEVEVGKENFKPNENPVRARLKP
jgi:hypothetical protein